MILVQGEPHQTSDLQDSKTINLGSFKPVILWKFIMAAIGNEDNWLSNVIIVACFRPNEYVILT